MQSSGNTGSSRLLAPVETAKTGRRSRFTLAELLVGATPSAMTRLNAQTSWAREGYPMGREVATISLQDGGRPAHRR